MKNIIKAAFLTSLITAAMVYVILAWQPPRTEPSRPPQVSWASPQPVSTVAPLAPVPPSSPPAPPAAPLAFSDEETNNIEVYQNYSPGVVNITTTVRGFDFFRGPVDVQSGTGSGVIIDTEGHIVTNHHVIQGARRLEVTLEDKTKHAAEVVGVDEDNDLAVIRIQVPPNRLRPVPLGTSDGLQVGQKVLAIGNPYGLERTLTTGIISSLGRAIEARNGRIIEDIIQTDAAINPGNSGGPLLNSAGQIIGINTAIVSSSGGSVGIGFAIPVNTVRRVTSDLITLGYVRRPYLGAEAIALSDYPGLARALRIETENGLLVVGIQPNGPGASGGLRGPSQEVLIGNLQVPVGGDVILGIERRMVNTRNDLINEINRHQPGDRITLSVLRDNQRIDLQIVLEEAPRR